MWVLAGFKEHQSGWAERLNGAFNPGIALFIYIGVVVEKLLFHNLYSTTSKQLDL